MRNYRWSVLLIAFLILGNMAVWPGATAVPLEYGSAEEWIEVNADSLPADWNDMARVPFSIRKQVLQQLPADTKKEIFKDGLRRFRKVDHSQPNKRC